MSFRVLHVLDHSWPVLDGYSNRSRSIVAAQRGLGWHPTVVTSPLHNLDDPAAAEELLDSVPYHRVPSSSVWTWRAIRGRWPGLREWAIVQLLEKRIASLLAGANFNLLHAHSPSLCGLAASRVAAARGIPLVYEIRSFWEDGIPQSPAALRYRLTRALETHVAKRADAVVGISQPILKDLAARGVSEQNLFHVPNGVDTVRFTPRVRDTALAAELEIDHVPTLGFIGTLFPWEGVPWMVRAAAALNARGTRFKLLIVGDGPDAEEVRKVVRQENAHTFVSYLGRVPHQDVERYYSVMDVVVYPRLSLRITELVTPLKPLEAMALGKAVLGSGVGGIRELIDSEVTGSLFEPGNVGDFCAEAARLLGDERLRSALGTSARLKVCEESDWRAIASRYSRVYEAATEAFHELD